MKKKIILLIIIIPLVFMLTLFTVGKAVSVVMRVPVSGIKILTESNDGLLTLDIAKTSSGNYDSLPRLQAQVLPVNAYNTEWKYSVSGDSVRLERAEDGYYIVPENVGNSKITVTSLEGGYTDSVTVEVTSSVLWDFVPTVNAGEITVDKNDSEEYDYSVTLSGGVYSFSGTAVPASFGGADAKWSSSDENVLKIDAYTGIARALTNGVCTVRVELEGGRSGIVEKEILVRVDMEFSSLTPVAVNGNLLNGTDIPSLTFSRESVAGVEFLLQLADPGSDFSLRSVKDETGAEVPLAGVVTMTAEPLGNGAYKVRIGGLDPEKSEEYTLTLGVTGATSDNNGYPFTIRFKDFDFGIYTAYHSSGDTVYQRAGTTVTYTAYSEIETEGEVEYSWRLINAGGVSIEAGKGAAAKISVVSSGAATLEVWADHGAESVMRRVEIVAVENVTSVSIMEAYAEWGMASEMALGKYSVNTLGNVTETSYTLDVRFRATEGGNLEAFNSDLLILTSSDTSVIRVSGGNKLTVTGDGKAEITAKWKYADYFNADVTDSFEIRAVANGVNVSDYESLRTATTRAEGYAIVLQNDIMLGKKGASLSELKAMAEKMPTTFDWQYYENTGSTRPEIYYLIRFTGDVHGNGYTLDGDYITRAEDAAGNPVLFKGPLSFVEVLGASVKGQDNIVFLADGDITLNNVVLKGCSDSSLLNENGEFDLSLLNYVGTTLEIQGNVRLINSRVSNGRTVVRVYGGATDSNGDPVVTSSSQINAASERYVVSIESCILTRAREFILKIGSNRALRATADASGTYTLPYLTSSAGTVYKPENAVAVSGYGGIPAGAVAPDYERGSEFYNEFVLTDVTVKDCVLQDSGLFTIGADAHFAGEALAGLILPDVLKGWRDLAATSYATVLRLEGDVRLLDWKNITNIDSSTLIEIAPGAGDSVQQFRLNVAEMLKTVRSVPGYENLLAETDGEYFGHGGIALYGGGLNYCGVDTSKMNTERFSEYKVNLSILESSVGGNTIVYLSKAAGSHDFVFYMYDAASETDLAAENEAIQSGAAYELPVAIWG